MTSKGGGRLNWVAGLFYSHFDSRTFAGTTPNFSSYMDLGSLQPATTANWFDAYEPTRLTQSAAYADATYAFTGALKLEVGGRFNHSDYSFSSCISGWGSALEQQLPPARDPSVSIIPVSTRNSIYRTGSSPT